jgi:ABC-2 type transport system ATP-binding protein
MTPPTAADRGTAESAVDIQALSHRYGDHLAVDNLDLVVDTGACFGLLGPNGAGKTTTIRLLNTLLPVQQGTVTVFGLDVRRQGDGGAPGARIRASAAVHRGCAHRTRECGLVRAAVRLPRRERPARVAEVLELVELTESADRLAATYSGGMVRRLELAQALVNRPALLVLDEPTVGLDPIARDSVWTRLRQMQEQYGMTVLLTTHYMEEADILCDRVALMHRGRLRAIGSPLELKAQLGPDTSLEDVFRHYTGERLHDEQGGLRDVRSTRRTARRLG